MKEKKAMEAKHTVQKTPMINAEEKNLIDSVIKKRSEIFFSEKGSPIPRKKGQSEKYALAYMVDCLKVSDPNTAYDLIENAAATRTVKDSNKIFSEIRDLDPQTPLESMLASQMVAVNDSIGALMRNAMFNGQNILGREANLNLATKLQRTFLQQIEALQRLKGKGQQTVTVKHVTVNEGGQAIVGNIEQKTIGGRG